MNRPGVETLLGHGGRGEVFDHGGDVQALHTQDVLQGELSSQVGIFAVCLLDTTEPQLSCKISDWREQLSNAKSFGFGSYLFGHALNQRSIERTAMGDRAVEDGRIADQEAVDTLGLDDRRDAQASFVDAVILGPLDVFGQPVPTDGIANVVGPCLLIEAGLEAGTVESA